MNRKEIYSRFAGFMSTMECDPDKDDYRIFEKSKHLLSQLSGIENSSLAVYDLHKRKYALVNSRFDLTLRYPEEPYYKERPEYFFSLMPDDDLRFTVNTTIEGLGFINSQAKGTKKDYKLIFEYRLSDPAGTLYRFLQQCVVLETDHNDRPWMVLILNDLLPGHLSRSRLKRRLVHIGSGKICLFGDESEQRSNYILTKREKEILDFIGHGLQSKEIAEQLFISVNTVNNHRQKIIEKMGTENTAEALTYARKIGIIP